MVPDQIDHFINQLQSLPVTQINKLDAILSDLANYLYEVAAEVSELLKKPVK